jgi:hypothetical protein
VDCQKARHQRADIGERDLRPILPGEIAALRDDSGLLRCDPGVWLLAGVFAIAGYPFALSRFYRGGCQKSVMIDILWLRGEWSAPR